MSYMDRLQRLKLPTLKYRRLRGDMIEVFKITHEIYDPEVSLKLAITRVIRPRPDAAVSRHPGRVVSRTK